MDSLDHLAIPLANKIGTILKTDGFALQAISAGFALLFLYWTATAVQRLYLSPLAKFPGPKLAALTGWYETYYEIFNGPGGQFPFHIEELHKQYGPIIRINPWELHINDPEYHEVIYHHTEPFDKPESLKYRFNAPHAAFSTPEHNLHKPRRAALAPFFSKRRLQNYAPYIFGLADRSCDRLTNEYKGTGKVVTMNDFWGSLVTDTITNYAFLKDFGYSNKPEFSSRFFQQLRDIATVGQYMFHFPILVPLANLIPPKVLGWFAPDAKALIDFQTDLHQLVVEVKERGYVPRADEDTHETVFNELLWRSTLPPEELEVFRLENEALGIIGAGIETTKESLTLASYYILADPEVYKCLREELIAAIPDPDVHPSLTELEQLPYLGACIEEAIRLQYGVASRSPRISWHKVLRYGLWVIPKGTPVSIQTWTMHHNEDVFPEPEAYRPERWLNKAKGPDGVKHLKRYMTSFGKGTRLCVGMYMAYTELYIALATVFRKFEFELFETDYSAVKAARIMVAAQPAKGTKGVRVLVK